MITQCSHIPVLYMETIDALCLENGQTIVDGTIGGGGHSQGILERIMPDGRLVGIDKDTAAVRRCKKRLHALEKNILFVHDDFKNIKNILEENGIKEIDGAVLDLGVSSFQLDERERGFSYQKDAPLDMRMNQENELSAKEVVNEYTENELTHILREYGEEKWAARIAKFIAKARTDKAIETTGELAQIIKEAIPAGARREGPHPAKRSFQAIRIEVNGELKGLGDALEAYVQALRSGGRLAVITFHSLEDRIVKQTFKRLFDPCECPKDFPICVCGKKSQIKLVTRKPVVPAEKELNENPRARSAKLRVVEKR